MYRLAERMMKGIHGLSPALRSIAMGIVFFCACTFLKRGEIMYYSYDNCLEKKALFNFITGERGNGKTYGYKTQIACKNYFEKGENFVYLRRFENELVKAAKSFFKDITHLYPETQFKITTGRSGTFFYERKRGIEKGGWNLMGYGVDLNTGGKDKSISYAGVTSICFDEFQSKRYLKNEIRLFLDLYETISRMNDVPVYFLSNSINVSNVYYDYFNLSQPYGKKRWKLTDNGLIYLEHTLSQDYRDAKKSTRFGQLIEGSKFGQYAIDNEYVEDTKDFIKKKTGDVKSVCNLVYLDNEYGLWFDRRNGYLYMDSTFDKSRVTYALTREDHTENTYFANRGRKIAWLNLMIQGYEQGFLYFENQRVKRIGLEILNMIR